MSKHARRFSVPAQAFLALGLLLGSSTCRLVDPTQVLLKINAESLARARGSSLRVNIWSSDGQSVLEGDPVPLTGAPEAAIELPTTIPVIPSGGDSARTFRVHAELIDATGQVFNSYRGFGSFVENQIVERQILLTNACNDVVCASGQSCTDGVCADVGQIPSAPSAPPPKQVGPGLAFATPCAAIAAAARGDVILIQPGTYSGEACVVFQDDLTIRGAAERPVIDAAGARVEGKALWLVRGANTTLENLELRNATGDDGVGSAVLLEGRTLTVRDVVVRGSQAGLYVNDDPASEVLVERSELVDNGTGAQPAIGHSIRIGRIKRFVLRDSWIHDGIAGHLVRTQAVDSTIQSNRLTGGARTDPSTGAPLGSSYELDFPTGGRALVIGNVLQQSNDTLNRTLLSYGEEGGLDTAAAHFLYVSHNTFVSRRGNGGDAVSVAANMPGDVRLVNDVFAGTSTRINLTTATILGDCIDPGVFQGEESYDFRLPAGSPCIDRGVPAGNGQGYSLTPTTQPTLPVGSEPRVQVRAPDPGAFESP